MPGYDILERSSLRAYHQDGIEENETKIGFIDFLMELKNNAENLPRLASYTVVGIEDVISMTDKADRHEMARYIHRILQAAASALERKNIQVQIVCNGKLTKGDVLWSDYRGEELKEIELIFSSTTKQMIGSCEKYFTGFNLSS